MYVAKLTEAVSVCLSDSAYYVSLPRFLCLFSLSLSFSLPPSISLSFLSSFTLSHSSFLPLSLFLTLPPSLFPLFLSPTECIRNMKCRDRQSTCTCTWHSSRISCQAVRVHAFRLLGIGDKYFYKVKVSHSPSPLSLSLLLNVY